MVFIHRSDHSFWAFGIFKPGWSFRIRINDKLTGHIRKPDQIIQPFQYGHAESKETCIWLKGINKMEPTDVLDIKEHGYLVTSGKHEGTWRWPNQAPCGAPKMGPQNKDRAKDKSVTFLGIAKEMARVIGGVA